MPELIDEQGAFKLYEIEITQKGGVPMNFLEWRAMGRPKGLGPEKWPTPWPNEENTSRYYKMGPIDFKMCDDCPPMNYPTDETRCAPCPRRVDRIVWGSEPVDFTHAIINGTHYIKNTSGTWRPDYSVPGTADRISISVDEAYDAHWPIGRWRE